jgi:Plasmid replication region DNA-binding N-term
MYSPRPTSVALIRAALGRGSPATIAGSLKRFWRDLGARAEGDPAALSRLPGDIAQLADGLWQRALALAA